MIDGGDAAYIEKVKRHFRTTFLNPGSVWEALSTTLQQLYFDHEASIVRADTTLRTVMTYEGLDYQLDVELFLTNAHGYRNTLITSFCVDKDVVLTPEPFTDKE